MGQAPAPWHMWEGRDSLVLSSYLFFTCEPRAASVGQPLDTFFLSFSLCAQVGSKKKGKRTVVPYLSGPVVIFSWSVTAASQATAVSLLHSWLSPGDVGRGHAWVCWSPLWGASLMHRVLKLILFMYPILSCCLGLSPGLQSFSVGCYYGGSSPVLFHEAHLTIGTKYWKYKLRHKNHLLLSLVFCQFPFPLLR